MALIKKGEVRNPKGRPKGSKNKLGEDFLSDFTTVWNEGGINALRMMLNEHPVDFVKVAASLMPKMVDINKQEKITIEIPWEIKPLRSITSQEHNLSRSTNEKPGGPASWRTDGRAKRLPVSES